MSDEKIWYIDRSRNYYYKELPEGLKAIVKAYKDSEGAMQSTDRVIQVLVDSGVTSPAAKNKFAHLTRFRDHGFINLYNNPGDSTIDYVEGKLDLDGMIIDHFIKRPFYKDNAEPNVKPFVLICCFFSKMMKVTSNWKEYYISVYECKKHLYNCKNYLEVDDRFVKQIISNRHSGAIESKNMPDNELTNFSIWFNAIKITALFDPKTNRETLAPNPYARSFFDFIADNATKLEPTPVCDEKGDSSLQYEYYCNRRQGLSEILPKVIKSNVRFEKKEHVRILFEFLFGIKMIKDFKYEKYVKNPENAFGVYNPLLFTPYLALRHLYYQNSFLAEDLYKTILGISLEN